MYVDTRGDLSSKCDEDRKDKKHQALTDVRDDIYIYVIYIIYIYIIYIYI